MRKRFLILILAITVFACFILSLLVIVTRLKTPPNRLILWKETEAKERYIEASLIKAVLSPGKKFVFVMSEGINGPGARSIDIPRVFSITPDKIGKDMHFVAVPFYYYVWNFLWVGERLVMHAIYGNPLIIEEEMNGIYSQFGKYKNVAKVLVWDEEKGLKIFMEGTSLYTGFVPGPDGKTIAMFTGERINDARKGFLYSLPEGKKIREVMWRGRCIGGNFRSTANYPHPFLFWDGEGKSAWVLDNEFIKYQSYPILVSLDFDGGRRELNGRQKKEWLYAHTKASVQPSPNLCAVIITKSGDPSSHEQIYIAHYSPSEKVWDERIPWEDIKDRFRYAEIVAITPEGKGIVFQDGVRTELWQEPEVRVWVWKIGYKKPRFVTRMPCINQAVGWLDKNHLLVVAGNKKKRFIGVLEVD